MLLWNPLDLSVYSVTSGISGVGGCEYDHPIAFDDFERNARLSYSLLLAASGIHKSILSISRSLTFLPIVGEMNYAWASQVVVETRNGEYPISDKVIGRNFLVLWPVSMAVDIWLKVRDICARAGPNSDSADVQALLNHPPKFSAMRPPGGFGGIDTDGMVDVRDLTVGQRLFVASLGGGAGTRTPDFAVRQPHDDWSERITAAEERALRSPLSVNAGLPRDKLRGSRKKCKRLLAQPPLASSVAMDLPDDVVERIVCSLLTDVMCQTETIVATVAQLKAVSRQFCECVNAVVARMLTRVSATAHSLLGHAPAQPASVQRIVGAAGLTLRQALSVPLDWRAYVCHRRSLADDKRPTLLYRPKGWLDGQKLLWE